MNYIRTSSRGSSRSDVGPGLQLGDILPNFLDIPPQTVSIYSQAGATILNLAQNAITEHYDRGCPPNSMVYFLAGYCNAVTREVEPHLYMRDHRGVAVDYGRYEEAYFIEEELDFLERMISFILEVDEYLKGEGLRPVFATIPPGHLSRWNYGRLEKGRTCILKYVEEYNEMQVKLNSSLTRLNGYIKKINTINAVYTPYLAGTVISTNKNSSLTPVFSDHKLHDGVHAGDTLFITWAKKFAKSMNKNREELLPTLVPRIHSSYLF